MKKNIFFILIFLVLNGCTQYSSIGRPAYYMAKTSNAVLTSNSVAQTHLVFLNNK